jgi:hypothetical protein
VWLQAGFDSITGYLCKHQLKVHLEPAANTLSSYSGHGTAVALRNYDLIHLRLFLQLSWKHECIHLQVVTSFDNCAACLILLYIIVYLHT